MTANLLVYLPFLFVYLGILVCLLPLSSVFVIFLISTICYCFDVVIYGK